MTRARASIAIAVAAIAAAAALFTPARAGATYLPQERVPTDSPVYRDLEQLATRYGLSPRFLDTRPLRLKEVWAFLERLAAEPGAAEDPAWLRAARLVDRGARGATRPLVVASADSGRQRLEISPYVSLLYADDPRYDPDINRDYRIGVDMAGSLDTSSVFVVNLYEGTSSQGGRGTPNFGTDNALVEGVDFNSWVDEAYVEFPVGKTRLLFGRSWLRWGPGRMGTLALSDAAPALDMLRAEATMFRNFRYTEFVALLDPGPQTYLAGHRLEADVTTRIALGFEELARFDGTSQVPLYLIPFVPYSFWEKRPKTGGVSPADTSGIALSKNNVLWSFDVAWNARPGLRVWGQFMMDDYSFSTDYKPDMLGYQLGLDARRRVRGADAIGATVEYTRVNNYVYSAWHGHDFGLDGFPLGFVLGPDAQILWGAVEYELGANWQFQVAADWRRKGEGQVGDPWLPSDGEVDASAFSGVVEEETRVAATVAYSPARWLTVQATVGWSEVENEGNVAGASDTAVPFSIGLKGDW